MPEDEALKQYACIIVDEAQFLTRDEVYYLVHLVDDCGIPVICYGLRADFRGDLFPGSYHLLVLADKLEEVKTICWCGKKAAFNARFDEQRPRGQGRARRWCWAPTTSTSACAAATGWPVTLGPDFGGFTRDDLHPLSPPAAPRSAHADAGETAIAGCPPVCRCWPGRRLHHWEEPAHLRHPGQRARCSSPAAPCGCVLLPEPAASPPSGAGQDGHAPAACGRSFGELIAQGAHNIDLVTAAHFLPWLLPALEPSRCPCRWCTTAAAMSARRRCGCCRVEGGQVCLPDLKYAMDGAQPGPLSRTPRTTSPSPAAAIRGDVPPDAAAMRLLTRTACMHPRRSSIRHLVLPGQPDNTRRVHRLAVTRPSQPGHVLVSLMSQYTPPARHAPGPLARRVTAAEYRAAVAVYARTAASQTASRRSAPPRKRNTPPPLTAQGYEIVAPVSVVWYIWFVFMHNFF